MMGFDGLFCMSRVPKFSGVHSIDLYIPSNFGADSTRIHFIGLKGEFTEVVANAANFMCGHSVLLQKFCDVVTSVSQLFQQPCKRAGSGLGAGKEGGCYCSV